MHRRLNTHASVRGSSTRLNSIAGRARRLAESAGSFVPEALEPRVLLAADPITPDHPLWLIPRGSAVVDGVGDDAAWVNAGEVLRTQATRSDNAVVVKMMYDDNGLYLLTIVDDENLWADGRGGGVGERWEIETDDSITFYFDPDNSRDEWFQGGDRAFGVNIANPSDPLDGDGVVRRWKLVKGNGQGDAPDQHPGGALVPGMTYATTVSGTINDSSDVDEGWVVEMFIPWTGIGMTGMPTHGQTFGMTFQMIQDNAGGDWDLVDHRDMHDRFLLPTLVDDYVDGVPSSYAGSRAGLRGPVNYAEAMFIDPRAGEQPAPITSITASAVSVYGAKLNFTAPAGTTTGIGHVSGYEIRYSTSPIDSEAAWVEAAKFENAYVPRLRGLSESIRISELAPGTTYYVAVRAVDGAGNLGALDGSTSFTTEALPSSDYRGHVIASPNGRTLQFENGEPFVPVGDHLGVSWKYTRTLFPGLIWDNGTSFVDFTAPDRTAVEDIDAYFDDLQAHGVNTMRTFLELEHVHSLGNPGPLPEGTYWLENTPGEYNDDMRQFIHSLLEKASARGIYIIFSPFDTFNYDEAFGMEGPWAENRGGPLSSMDHFFQETLGTVNLATLELAKARMQRVISWVNQSPHKDAALGFEVINEWDSYEWTLHPDGLADDGRETEFRTRAVFINELAGFMKMQAPNHLVINSMVARNPRGPAARLDFLSRNFDLLAPHIYTNGNEEPINNPLTFTEVYAAEEMGHFTAYWIVNREDRAPVLNGEWGLTKADWPGPLEYSSEYTQAEDERIFRAVIWSGFASGQVGTGLRIATDELVFRGMILTNEMRDLQKTFSNFVNGGSVSLDFTDFTFQNLTGRLDATSAAGKSLRSWGISDGSQGVVYVVQDRNESSGTVNDGRITLSGLRADQLLDIEFWSTLPGATSPMHTVSGKYIGTGNDVVIQLPAFTEDIAVKFVARPSNGSVQELVTTSAGGSFITFALGPDRQPTARIEDSSGNATVYDISTLAGFRGRVLDMTPYVTSDIDVHLALTDENHHVWLLHGSLATNSWWAENLTAISGAPGLTGDLTSYQPSWGSIHIAGLDARGHAINYWWAPAEPYWHHSDLTGAFAGPALAGGLTGYVSGWDGLNLAGLDADGNVIVYWWAPGIEEINGGDPGKWLVNNMTTQFGGPQFTGQLDAYVTPWGGLNVAGTTEAGEVWTYWWAPGMDGWEVSNLSVIGGLDAALEPGVEVTVSPHDGGINIFGRSADGHLHMLRWKPESVWTATDVTAGLGGTVVSFPMSGGSAGNRLLLATAGQPGVRSVVIFNFFLDSLAWETEPTSMMMEPTFLPG